MRSTAATPSSSALCASIGPGITSPIAKTPGTLVSKCSFTVMRPRSSNAMPISRAPSSSAYGRRPDRHQHHVGILDERLAFRLERDPHPVRRALRLRRRRLEAKRQPLLLQHGLQLAAHRPIHQRHDAVEELDDRDLRSETRHTDPSSSPTAPAPTTRRRPRTARASAPPSS